MTRKRNSATEIVLDPFLGSSSDLSGSIPGYHYRADQLAMAARIFDSFGGAQKQLLIEAGTGIGKSFAYLIPAFLKIAEGLPRVVVSTRTLHLQQQLIEKDIPTLKKAFTKFKDITVTVLRGRSNYLCRRRLDGYQREGEGATLSLFEESRFDSASFYNWAGNTDSGYKGDYPGALPLYFWSKVRVEKAHCLGRHCQFYSSCFFFNSRKNAARSSLVVVNHALLFADCFLSGGDGQVIPHYSHLIVDEAHHFEAEAESAFSFEWNRKSFLEAMKPLTGRGRGGLSMSGQFESLLAEFLQKYPDEHFSLLELWQRVEVVLLPRLSMIQKGVEECFDSLAAGFVGRSPENKKVVLQSPFRIPQVPLALQEPFSDLVRLIAELTGLMRSIYSSLDALMPEGNPVVSLLILVKSSVDFFATTSAILREIIDSFPVGSGSDGRVAWISEKGGEVNIQSVPLNVSVFIKARLYQKLDTIVMLSATLMVSGTFDFFRSRVGLDNTFSSLDCLCYPGPFDYNRKVLFYNSPQSFQPLEGANISRFHELVKSFLTRIPRGCFLLFTSIRDMNEAYESLHLSLKEMGFTTLKQGSASNFFLISEFKASAPKVVLFAVDSFWEGVDIPGEDLFSIIFFKLPFDVPTEPLFRAKSSLVEEAGGSGFADYALPRTILALKQGIGRLLRNEEDRGIIILLDNRLQKRAYGTTIIKSLPPMKFHFFDFDGFLKKAGGYFNIKATSTLSVFQKQ